MRPIRLFMLFATVSISANAIGEELSVRFTGSVQILSDADGFLARAGVVNGDIVNGRFVYETTDVPYHQSGPHPDGSAFAAYTPLAYSFVIGENKLVLNSTIHSQMDVYDDWPGTMDFLQVFARGYPVNPLTSESKYFDYLSGWVADRSGTLWSGTALPMREVLEVLIDPAQNPQYQSFSKFRGPGVDLNVNSYVWTIDELQTPSELLEELAVIVVSINLQAGIASSLDAKLDNALAALDDTNENNDGAAINSIYAFCSSTEAQRGKKLTDEQADTLIEAANAVIAAVDENAQRCL